MVIDVNATGRAIASAIDVQDIRGGESSWIWQGQSTGEGLRKLRVDAAGVTFTASTYAIWLDRAQSFAEPRIQLGPDYHWFQTIIHDEERLYVHFQSNLSTKVQRWDPVADTVVTLQEGGRRQWQFIAFIDGKYLVSAFLNLPNAYSQHAMVTRFFLIPDEAL